MKLRLLDFIYIGRRRALELGFTHEGTLLGVPAWMLDVTDEQVLGCPKIFAFQAWAIIADLLFELATYIMPAGFWIEAPIHVRGLIKLRGAK